MGSVPAPWSEIVPQSPDSRRPLNDLFAPFPAPKDRWDCLLAAAQSAVQIFRSSDRENLEMKGKSLLAGSHPW